MEDFEYWDRIRKARRNFVAMAATYALGVFNDNFFKQALMLIAVAAGLLHLQGWATIVFTLPFILFAAPAGWAADRFSKRTVVIGSKALEVVAMSLGAVGIMAGSWPLVFVMLGIMALQSTLFSPALNGSIPELYPERFVIKANARLKVITTAAILAGYAMAGMALYAGRGVVVAVILAVSTLGLLVSLGVPRRPAAAPERPFPWSGPVDTLKTLNSTRRDRLLAISIASDAVFWFVASLQILLINPMGLNQFGFGEKMTSLLVAAELIGVACGGLLSGWISHGRRWYWVLAPSAFFLGLFMVLVGFVPAAAAGSPIYVLFLLLAACGVAGGIFYIPLQAFIQVRPAADRKGAILAAANFACFTGILISGPVSNLLNAHLAPTTGFALAGLLMIGMSLWLAAIWNSAENRRRITGEFLLGQLSMPFDAAIRIFVKGLLALRYRVRVKGLDEIADRGTTGLLFLPNHPAFVDPFIVASTLNRWFAPRFLADKDQVDRFFIRWLAKRAGVRPIPDASRYHNAGEKIEQVLDESIKGLRAGENLLFYPAGRINHSRFEDLGGKSAVEKILREAGDVRVILVRTRGLWGSMFSRARGHHPVVPQCMKRALKSLLLSGIFFAPRREVTIEFVEPEDFPREADRSVLNRYLEAFYNADAPCNTYVPYTIWERGGTRAIPEPPPERTAGRSDAVAGEIRRKVIEHLREVTGRDSMADEDTLGRDLGIDSLSMVEIVVWLEEEFAAAHVTPQGLSTVGDVILAAAGEGRAAETAAVKPPPEGWFEPVEYTAVTGGNLAEAFLSQAAAHPRRIIVADQISGAKTYRDLVTAILVLRPFLEKLPGKYLGIMFPASVAADTLVFAALFAGKTPVMVNWTVGTRNMTHSLDSLGVEKVLTAGALAQRVEFQLGDLAGIKERFVFVEDIAARASIARKALAWLRARSPIGGLGAAGVRETAVVLFTSGSESLPKAVPLTHANILANVRDVLTVIDIHPDERMVGIFPPFHSFGLTCTTFLPLAGGIRVFHHPNPTEGETLARLVEAYGGTMLLGTPTFLSTIVRAAGGAQLDSLRSVVSGAERCPPATYEYVGRRCPGAVVLEGYGVTECSPVVSVNDRAAPVRFTIGKVLPSIEYAIVDVETGERAASGAAGVLLVRGESVFGGYLEYEGASPFVEFDGRRWYRTGDLVTEDENGVLTFAGRLKRFIKLGGEMISLPAIEAVLDKIYAGEDDEGPVIAVEATPVEVNPEIVLFTTRELDRARVNHQIREAGLSALHSVRRVMRLDEIPLLGTGKTDYRALSAMLAREG